MAESGVPLIFFEILCVRFKICALPQVQHPGHETGAPPSTRAK